MKRALTFALALAAPGAAAQDTGPVWEREAAMPGLGRSGMCAGLVGDMLVALGGSNFPEPGRTVTRGGEKRLYRDGWVLGLRGREWRRAELLEAPLDQALSVPVEGGFACIGGTSGESIPRTSAIRVRARGGELVADALPPLPFAIGAPVGGRIGSALLVASGNRLVSLDLRSPERGWRERAALPWQAREEAAAGAADGLLFVMGGRRKQAGRWQVSREVLAYDPRRDRWTRRAEMPLALSSATLVTLSGALFLIGGVERETFERIDAARTARDAAPAGSSEHARLEAELTALYDNDGGFNAAVYRYDVARDRWDKAGWHPGAPAIKRPVVAMGNSALLVGGEVNPGKRTPVIWRVSP